MDLDAAVARHVTPDLTPHIPHMQVCDEWISTLQTTLSILYQKSPLFSQDFLRVYMMDGTFTTMPLTETTKTRDVVKFMCKKHTLNNESEFGLLELWDHPGINGNMSERKLPNDELLLDQTMLTWEQAARKRFGIVNTVPHTAFKLVMRKLSSLLPQARTKKEQHLEFCQAMADLKDGRFTVEDKSEIFDLAALAIFKDLQEGLSEAEQEEELVLEEGQLTAQLHHYLPSYWFKALENKKSSMRQQQIEEWDRKVVQSFNELTRSELREDECITEVRKIVYSFRLETELNALASTRMFIERVRLAPLCFSAQYIAEMWSVDKILKVRASCAPSPRRLPPPRAHPRTPSHIPAGARRDQRGRLPRVPAGRRAAAALDVQLRDAGVVAVDERHADHQHHLHDEDGGDEAAREAALPHARVDAHEEPALQVRRGRPPAGRQADEGARGAHEATGGGGRRRRLSRAMGGRAVMRKRCSPRSPLCP